MNKSLVLLSFLAFACVQDILAYKISNKLIMTGILTGTVIAVFESGMIGFIQGVFGIILPVCILFIFYLAGVFGAGDIKLFSVIGSFLGFHAACSCFLTALFIGGIFALIKFVRKYNSIIFMRYPAKSFPLNKQTDCNLNDRLYFYDKNSVIHFTIPILLSVLLYQGGVF